MRPSPFLPALLLLGAFFAACGFDGIGGALDGEGSPGSASPGTEGGPGSTGADGDGGPAEQTDAGVVVITDAGLDDTGLVDAAVPPDAGPPLPTNPGPPLAYVVSGRFWTFDPTSGAWSGGTALPANDCPALDELAVDPFGVLFAVGNNATALYRVDPTSLTCTAIGPAGTGYPQSLAFAPRGTLDPYTEVLVGYTANGDYVRIDTTTGARTVVTAAALAGLVVGDLVNVGPKGYVAVNGGSCGTGDCIWEISFSTGKAIAPGAASAKLPSATHVTGLAHWSGKLQAFCGPDEVYSLDPTNAAAATLRAGPPGYTNVVYHGAGSRTIAPTN